MSPHNSACYIPFPPSPPSIVLPLPRATLLLRAKRAAPRSPLASTRLTASDRKIDFSVCIYIHSAVGARRSPWLGGGGGAWPARHRGRGGAGRGERPGRPARSQPRGDIGRSARGENNNYNQRRHLALIKGPVKFPAASKHIFTTSSLCIRLAKWSPNCSMKKYREIFTNIVIRGFCKIEGSGGGNKDTFCYSKFCLCSAGNGKEKTVSA